MKTNSLKNCVAFQTWFKNRCFFQMLPAVNDIDVGGVPPGGLERQAATWGILSISSLAPYSTFIAQVETIPML